MSTDRELLELAAKAAELPVEWDGDGYVIASKFRGYLTNYDAWNPLTDDGDALRLAVNLHITIDRSEVKPACFAYCDFQDTFVEVVTDHGTDPYAATRRAIVTAAAEIGKAKLATAQVN